MGAVAEEIVVCPQCGTKNRINPALAHVTKPVCGRCRSELSATGGAVSSAAAAGPIEVTDSTFAREVLSASQAQPVLVDCWAPWCGPCRMIAPVIDQLAAESGGRYRVAKLNTDENQQTAGSLSIDGIPTLLIFHQGRVVDRLVGVQPKTVIAQRLARAAG